MAVKLNYSLDEYPADKYVANEFGYPVAKGLHFSDDNPDSVSMTEQHHKDDADINRMIDKYGLSAVISTNEQPNFGDFSDITDFHQMKNTLIEVEQQFMMLNANLRDRFNNDPQELLSFLGNPENRLEAEELGLMNQSYVKVATPEVAKVEEAVKPAENPTE